MKKILLATGNQGKAQEMLEFFENVPFEFCLLSDFPEVPEPKEDGNDYEENALIKAKYFGNKFQIPTLGEDSGLVVQAFPEKFGLKTRREIPSRTDEEWLEKFMRMMNGVSDRRATFSSAMAFFEPLQNLEKVVLNSTSGIILEETAAGIEKGIPISAIFQPDGHDLVYSAMTKHQKNTVSHRGKSAKAMLEILEEFV